MYQRKLGLLFIATMFFACEHVKENVPKEKLIDKPLGRIINDSIEPPIVTSLMGANAPRVIKAGKPIKVPLQNTDGFEFPNITEYTIADGLPVNEVLASAVDSKGNMWFTTPGYGICKYDGVSFTNYTMKNGLSSDTTDKIMVDSRNNVWIETTKGADIFDGKTFKHVDFGGVHRFYTDIIFFEDHQGTVWYSRYDYKKGESELYSYQMGNINKYPSIARLLRKNGISKILEDKEFNLILSTQNGNYVFDGKTLQPFTRIPNYNGRAPRLVFCDSKGDIWFCDRTSGNLGKFDGNTSYLYAVIKNPKSVMKFSGASEMIEAPNGNYLVSGSDSIYQFNMQKFESIKTLGITTSFNNSFTKDSLGNIWISKGELGITKITFPHVRILEYQDKGLVNSFTSWGTTFTIDKFNNKWIGNSNGLGKYVGGYIYYYGKQLLDSGKFILSVYADRAGNIWINILNRLKAYQKNPKGITELVKFDGEKFTIYGEKQGIDLYMVASIDEDSEDNIWLSGIRGSSSSRIIRIDKMNITNFGEKQGFKSEIYHRSFQDRKNKYWFAGGGDLITMDGKETKLYDHRDGLDSNTSVNDLTEDEFGNIWLATDKGVVQFNGKSFIKYTSTIGLDKRVGDVISDTTNHQLWFSTLLGIASISKDEINKPIPFVNHYTRKSGFDINTPWQRSMQIDRQGNIWWNNGIKQYRFNYPAIKQQKLYPVTIKNILLVNKNVSWVSLLLDQKKGTTMDSLSVLNETALKFNKNLTKEETGLMLKEFGDIRFDSIVGSDFIPINLKIPFRNNNIRFEFASLSPSFSKYAQYQYLLEGYDKNWSSLSTKTEASFGNMHEGDYTFRVKSLDVLGNWSETSYAFTVFPPWYRTWWAFIAYILLFAGTLRAYIVYRSSKLKQENLKLETTVEKRTSELNRSLENLKATQTQLIQSEKMASLGELTAGIAHEIQNPLNLVNNFSEVNKELLVELNEEIDKGNYEDVKAIAKDVIDNEEKINHHGKRADAIVKGMLQHSRSSSGAKEPTDINALADEYFRLAYHGLRAKDKSFNANMVTDFDASIGKVNIVPQDIGRAILNLITNAFYAVAEKKKIIGEGYEPTVTVATKRSPGKILISVADNGNGIPQKVVDKIFQPFFTTKPTGQGTGLGLSLSYDIVKAHGGELKVETKEGVGSEFIISLPI